MRRCKQAHNSLSGIICSILICSIPGVQWWKCDDENVTPCNWAVVKSVSWPCEEGANTSAYMLFYENPLDKLKAAISAMLFNKFHMVGMSSVEILTTCHIETITTHAGKHIGQTEQSTKNLEGQIRTFIKDEVFSLRQLHAKTFTRPFPTAMLNQWSAALQCICPPAHLRKLAHELAVTLNLRYKNVSRERVFLDDGAATTDLLANIMHGWTEEQQETFLNRLIDKMMGQKFKVFYRVFGTKEAHENQAKVLATLSEVDPDIACAVVGAMSEALRKNVLENMSPLQQKTVLGTTTAYVDSFRRVTAHLKEIKTDIKDGARMPHDYPASTETRWREGKVTLINADSIRINDVGTNKFETIFIQDVNPERLTYKMCEEEEEEEQGEEEEQQHDDEEAMPAPLDEDAPLAPGDFKASSSESGAEEEENDEDDNTSDVCDD